MKISSNPTVKPEGMWVQPDLSMLEDEWEVVEWGMVPDFDILVVVLQHAFEKDEVVSRVYHVEEACGTYLVSVERDEDGMDFPLLRG